jgi:uncharacterized protein (TIGR03084 family)
LLISRHLRTPGCVRLHVVINEQPTIVSQTSALDQLHQQIQDFHSEADALCGVLADMAPDAWRQPTGFKHWTIWDVVAHLHHGDTFGLTTLTNPDEYQAMAQARQDSDLPRTEYTAAWLGAIDGPTLLARWKSGYESLCAAFMRADPQSRLAWSGPGMKPRMFMTSRQMETWAHGFAVYDLLGGTRQHADRLRNIATLGVRTFGWTFANRGLPVPNEPPHVSLTSPSGQQWEWNAESLEASVNGSAVEFCQVVTQVRNIKDVSLDVRGDAAVAWMAVAQCFAGPPEQPPAPGTRGAGQQP